MSRVKMRVTLTGEYEADPRNYGDATLEGMAIVDEESLSEDPGLFLDIVEWTDFKVVPLSD